MPTTDSVTIAFTGIGAGDAQWNAVHGGGDWITVIRPAGTGDGAAVWSRDATGLAPGVWIDTITVSVSGAGVSDQIVVDTLVVATAFSLTEAADELFFGGVLNPLQKAFLEALGNDDGTYNVGDVLAWVDWCNRGASGGCVPEAGAQRVPDQAGEDPPTQKSDSSDTRVDEPVRRQ
jgi:hypothetical protein